MTEVLATAKQYVDAGLSVIPVRADGTKAPAESGWRTYSEKRATAQQVEQWFASGNYGIGIAGGSASGNLAVLDFEQWEAYDTWLKSLSKEAIERTRSCPLAATPGGGAHLYVRLPESVSGQVLAKHRTPEGKPKVLIEIRGAGHQVVAPGSPPQCHPSGKVYAWLRESWITGGKFSETPWETWQQWLEAAQQLNEVERNTDPFQKPAPTAPVTPQSANYVAPANPTNSPGDDFNSRGTWEETGLFESGWKWHQHSGDDRGSITRPGKGEGCSGTLGMVVAKDGGHPLFYCFSSNAAPFEAGQSYSRFRTYTLLRHRGDFAASARALGERGYGAPKQRVGTIGPQAGSQPPTSSAELTGQGQKVEECKYRFIDSEEFRKADYRVDWFIDWFLARGQPGVVAGPSKGMKTSTLVDLAVSVATGTQHLNKWKVNKRARVAVVSGESGGYTLQETFQRILRARGLPEDACDGWLKWEFSLPVFADMVDTSTFAAKLGELGCELVIIDPFYLTLGEIDAKNMFEMGRALRAVSELLLARHGVTPLIAHHANRLLPIGEPMELQHLAYSGLEQFARQYVFLNRREAYKNDGTHSLWYRYGGSAGHSGLYAVTIDEGVLGPLTPQRHWQVEVATPSEVRQHDYRIERQQARELANTKERVDEETVLMAIDAECRTAAGATEKRIRELAAMGQSRVKTILSALVEAGVIENVRFTKSTGNGSPRLVDGYKRTDTPE